MWKCIKYSRDGLALLLAINLMLAPAAHLVARQQDFIVSLMPSLNPAFAIDWPEIERLYAALGNHFIWHREGRLTPQAAQLYGWLASADQEGLETSDYHVPLLRLLMETGEDELLLQRELLLTDGYLRLARDLRNGRYDPKQVDPLWQLPSDRFDPVTALASALRKGSLSSLLTSLRPQSTAYLRLQRALARYRAFQSSGGWRSLKIDETLRPGSRHPAVIPLRERLAAEGFRVDWPPDDTALFDPRLTAAVKAFQRRQGLVEDGAIGRETLQALNIPVEARIEEIRVNLERWRWLPSDMETQYLLINTAAFEIELMEQDQARFHRRTVNGREGRQTPSFRSRVTHLVANPEWTVPRSIAVKDLLPKQQADGGFLQSKQIRVFRQEAAEWFEIDPSMLDWSLYHADNFPFVLKQDAGGENSLGRIKFHMPNHYDIYLHDTPAQGLFARAHRAFSSGCVRVQDAGQLAELLLARAGRGEDWRFRQALRTGETLMVSLVQPMPVYLAYFTSWVDEANEVHFRPDVYQRDTQLLFVLAGGGRHLTAQHIEDKQARSL